MDQPMTWGDYLAVRAVLYVAAFLLTLFGLIALGLLAAAREKLHCRECDRRMVRRDGKLALYEQRYFCPFHDPRDP